MLSLRMRRFLALESGDTSALRLRVDSALSAVSRFPVLPFAWTRFGGSACATVLAALLPYPSSRVTSGVCFASWLRFVTVFGVLLRLFVRAGGLTLTAALAASAGLRQAGRLVDGAVRKAGGTEAPDKPAPAPAQWYSSASKTNDGDTQLRRTGRNVFRTRCCH